MRLVVATGGIGPLSSQQTGECFARAWASLGVRCAVVPIGDAGAGFCQAASDLWDASLNTNVIAGLPIGVVVDTEHSRVAIEVTPRETDPWRSDSRDLGQALGVVLDAVGRPGLTVYLDLASNRSYDGGRGLVEALGIRSLDGITLIGVVPADELEQPLVGLRGIVSVHGRPTGLDVAELLTFDQRLVDWADELSAKLGSARAIVDEPGAGACGGAAAAILGLGGQVDAGCHVLADQAGLLDTIRAADLVVTGCDQLDFGSMGGQTLRHVVGLAEFALRPVIALAGRNYISSRELRSVGIEQAYGLLGDVRQAYGLSASPGEDGTSASLVDELTSAAARIARSWVW